MADNQPSDIGTESNNCDMKIVVGPSKQVREEDRTFVRAVRPRLARLLANEDRRQSIRRDSTVQTLQFPRPAVTGSSRWSRLKSRLLIALGTLLNRLGAPGAVRNVDIEDSATGYRISVRTGPMFTRISVNGRDFFFRRFTGRFDGTGSSCVRP